MGDKVFIPPNREVTRWFRCTRMFKGRIGRIWAPWGWWDELVRREEPFEWGNDMTRGLHIPMQAAHLESVSRACSSLLLPHFFLLCIRHYRVRRFKDLSLALWHMGSEWGWRGQGQLGMSLQQYGLTVISIKRSHLWRSPGSNWICPFNSCAEYDGVEIHVNWKPFFPLAV